MRLFLPIFSYNKTEYLKPGSPELMTFTHLIVEAKSKYSPNLKPYVKTHNIISIIETFSHLQFSYGNFIHNVVTIKTKPSLFILKRKDLIEKDKGGSDEGEREKSESRSSNERVVIEERQKRDNVMGDDDITEEKVKDKAHESSEGEDKDESRLKGDDRTGRVREEDTRQLGRNSEDDVDNRREETDDIKEQTNGKEELSNERIKNETKEKIEKDREEEQRIEESVRESIMKRLKASMKIEKDLEEEKRIEESVQESILERLKARFKEGLQAGKEKKRRGKGERDDTVEKILLPINMDELSKGDFVGTKYEEEVVGKQDKEALTVNSIREDIKKTILLLKLREKIKSKQRAEEKVRESSDEYINIEDE